VSESDTSRFRQVLKGDSMASRIAGITIEIGGDTTKLQSALKGVQSSLSKTQSELKDVEKLLKFSPTNTELLRQKQKLLADQIKNTKDKLQQLKDAQAQMDADGVDKNSEAYMNLQREIIETESKLKNLQTEARNFGSVGAQQVKAVGEKLQEVGKHLEDFGKKWTQYVSAPLAALGIGSVKTAADFEASMSQVAATMGYTVEDLNDGSSEASQNMQRLTDFAREMGATTAFSADEAAEALNYMALAGYDVDKSMDMLPIVLDLAAAGSIDLAQASDMVTDAQTALGLTAEETKTMVDQMARSSSRSNTSVAQLGEAILTVGATARGVKGGTQELSSVLGILADNGIKGSEAGTKLRNILLAMTPSTDDAVAAWEKLGVSAYDADGSLRPLPEIFQELNTAMEGMSQEEKTRLLSDMFNKTDLAAINSLLGTTAERWEDLSGEIENASGAAGDMADTQLNNLKGQLTLLKSAIQDVAIEIGNIMLPYVKRFVEWVQKLTTKFSGLSDRTKRIIVIVGAVIAAVGPLLIVIGKVSMGISALMELAPLLAGPFGIVIAIIAAVVAAGVLLYKNWDTVKEKAGELIAAVSGAWESIKLWTAQTWENIKTSTLEAWENIKTAITSSYSNAKQAVVDTATEIWTSIVTTWETIKTDTITKWNEIKTSITSKIRAAKTSLIVIATAINTALSAVWETIKTTVGESWDAIKNEIQLKFEAAKTAVTTTVNGIKTTLSTAWTAIKTRAQNGWDNIKSAITSPFESAKNTLSGIVNTIKGFFPINIGKILSNIQLPHFSVQTVEKSFFGKTISIPTIDVQWYRKAMNDAIMLDGASIFGMMGGKMLGGGEAGREVVISYDKLAQMMGGNNNQTVINVNVNGYTAKDDRALADMVARRIQQKVMQKGAVWA